MANAQAGRNLDILELTRLVVPIRQDQGGTGATTAKQGLTNLIVNAAGVPFKDTDYSGTLKQDTLTANRTWTLPDATGTLATEDYADGTQDIEDSGAASYVKLPGGLLLQWGVIQTGSTGSADVTFPQAFAGIPMHPLCGVAGVGDTTLYSANGSAPTKTGFTIWINTAQSSIGCTWLCAGRWK